MQFYKDITAQDEDMDSDGRVTVFLAGGITGCPDWQRDIRCFLSAINQPVMTWNPRKKDWNMECDGSPDAVLKQIKWEYERLEAADIILFWFPKATLCPIVLHEFGRYNTKEQLKNRRLVVGTEEGYARHMDVELQTKCTGTGITIHRKLTDLIYALEEEIKSVMMEKMK